MRVLVVDDEAEMAALLARGLLDEGHDVTTAPDGIAALTDAARQPFDVAVLDVMMPGMSGFELCRHLKRQDATTAIILLTARDAIDDRVRGLDAGADDYMIKPFAFAELSARIRAVRRRDALTAQSRLTVGTVDVDLHRHRAEAGGRPVPLSRTEFDVLRVLAEAGGEVVRRTALLEEVWGSSENIDPNVLDQYVSYLRRKLAAAAPDVQIETTRRVGYALRTAGGPGA
ncbi:response regulator transcription factor [Promicromonospora sukumoe]|uniref:DNA-binding response OmpR family regulator n=1 Tax=Promicromonospora sukumoe TaxID=88382 RepID=A0A7W3J7Q6_9MICO|nr:response regulator transcription factor [Promicromonospora sukumoe]MBA8807842.1 DNA-binding response OmpR family regulator [Promicromonospora sukumoe]